MWQSVVCLYCWANFNHIENLKQILQDKGQKTHTKERKKMMNTITEYTLYANMGELENAQGYEALKLKAEKILANAERKGIKADIEKMIDELKGLTGIAALTEEINAINQIVYEYQKPTDRQVAFAEKLAEEFNKPAPKADLQHGFQWFSQFIAYGIEASKTLPPTEKQVKLLDGMRYCPDCPSQDGMTFNRGQASEFISKYNEAFQAWKLTRASHETITQLLNAYKKADDPKTYEFCLQFDESTAQKMIGQLKLEYERLKAKSTQSELEDFFRQDFIDEDNEKRKKAKYMPSEYEELFNMPIMIKSK